MLFRGNYSSKQTFRILGPSHLRIRPIILPARIAVMTVPSRMPTNLPRNTRHSAAATRTLVQSKRVFMVEKGFLSFPAKQPTSPSAGMGARSTSM